jgi:hypothetical protein
MPYHNTIIPWSASAVQWQYSAAILSRIRATVTVVMRTQLIATWRCEVRFVLWLTNSALQSCSSATPAIPPHEPCWLLSGVSRCGLDHVTVTVTATATARHGPLPLHTAAHQHDRYPCICSCLCCCQVDSIRHLALEQQHTNTR